MTAKQLRSILEENIPNEDKIAKILAIGKDLDFTLIKSPQLRVSVLEWVDWRKVVKAPIKTQKQVELTIDKLKKLSGGKVDIAIEIINQSIVNGWQGLFELKDEQQSKPRNIV